MQSVDFSKSLTLRELRNSSCNLCSLHAGASSVCVIGEGSGSLPVMILGEAPGRSEDAMNRPFVGASGKLLRSTLLEAGLPLKKCYITNTVKCFPNGTPTDKEQAICAKNYLQKEIQILKPKYILSLGKIAFNNCLPGYDFKEVRGQLLDPWVSDAFLFPVWHPAYILRNRGKQKEWKNDLENFVALVEVDNGVL